MITTAQKLDGIKSHLQTVESASELKELAQKAYQLTSQQYLLADQHSTGPSDFKSNFRFKSLHHLEYLLQDAERIAAEHGLDHLRSECITALNLVMVVLEDDSTIADLSNTA